MLGRHRSSDVLGVRLEELDEPEERPRAQDNRRITPAGKRALRRLDRRIEVRTGRQRRSGNDTAGRGVEDVGVLPGRRATPAAADVVLDDLDVGDAFSRRGARCGFHHRFPENADYTARRAAARTSSGVQPRARSSRTPESPLDLLSFCDVDFMMRG